MGRMERVNQQMKREISLILQKDISDPRLMFVTITGVTVSPDLHVARVRFSTLGGDKQLLAVQESLDRASGFIRRLIGERIRLRLTPKIEFVYDDSIAYSDRIERTIQEIHDANSKSPQDN